MVRYNPFASSEGRAMLQYNPLDWFWRVSTDQATVWSSAAAKYVSVDDLSVERFLNRGGIITPIDSADALRQVMHEHFLPAYCQRGVEIHSGTSEVSGTYSLEEIFLTRLGNLARDLACGLGLPGDVAAIQVLDVNGNPHTLYEQSVRNVYLALRDYKARTAIWLFGRVAGSVEGPPSVPVEVP